MTSAADPQRTSILRSLAPFLAALCLVAATFLVYLPTPGDYWIRYDNELLLREPRIQALTLEGRERMEALVEMFTTPHGDLYQPLMTFSIAIDAKLFGDDRTGYHAHALALHLAIVLGLFALARRLTRSDWPSFLAMLVVCVHPILVETVSWIVHRTILTATLWVVIGSHVYLVYARDPRRLSWLVLATIAYSVSLLGKSVPSVVLVPLAIDLWVGRRAELRILLEKLPLFLVVFGVGALNWFVSNAAVHPETTARPFADVFAEAPAAAVLTVANVVWPADLTIFYTAGQIPALIGERWVAVVIAAGVAGAGSVALWRRGCRGPLLAIVLWFGLLGPYLFAGSYRETSTADRYAYTGTMLLPLGIAAALAHLFGQAPPPRRATAWLAVVVVLAMALPLGVQARHLARRWSDEAVLWNSVLERSPHPTPFGALARVYRARGDFEAAMQAAEGALALLPSEPIASRRGIYHLSAAQIGLAAYHGAARNGSVDEATIERYRTRAAEIAREATTLWPDRPEFHYGLGRALLAAEDYRGAEAAFARVIALQPDWAAALTRRALAQYELGDLDAAIESAANARRVSPRDAQALKLLANLFWEQSRYSEAAEASLAWAELQPGAEMPRRGFFASVAALKAKGAVEEHDAWMQRYRDGFGVDPSNGASLEDPDPAASPRP